MEDQYLNAALDKARRNLISSHYEKGTPHEREYSRVYDKMALKGIGNRRRLRKKYRS